MNPNPDQIIEYPLSQHHTVVPTAPVLASEAEAIVRTRKRWPKATKRRTGD